MDDVILAEGLSYSRILSWGDPINKLELYGDNNDFISILKIRKNMVDVRLWVAVQVPT